MRTFTIIIIVDINVVDYEKNSTEKLFHFLCECLCVCGIFLISQFFITSHSVSVRSQSIKSKSLLIKNNWHSAHCRVVVVAVEGEKTQQQQMANKRQKR
jgi:hypothetical protein